MSVMNMNPKRFGNFLLDDAKALTGMLSGRKYAAYIGLVGYENLGDEVLYDAHKALFPEHDFLPYRKDIMNVEAVAKVVGEGLCDHAILGGGTLINDGYDWLNKTEKLLDNGTKLFCIGTGVESPDFYNDAATSSKLLDRWVKALARFEYVGVRGPQSMDILTAAGAKNIHITGDTALALTPEHIQRPQSSGQIGITYGDVAGNPMWGDPATYKSEMVKVIKSLLASGRKVVLLPVWSRDVPSNVRLSTAINHPNLTIKLAYKSYASFVQEIQKCDFFVGQKLHASIIAYMHAVPTIMIEYRPKCLDFMKSIEQQDYLLKTSDFNEHSFSELFNKLETNATGVTAISMKHILEYKSIQFEQAAKLKTILRH